MNYYNAVDQRDRERLIEMIGCFLGAVRVISGDRIHYTEEEREGWFNHHRGCVELDGIMANGKLVCAELNPPHQPPPCRTCDEDSEVLYNISPFNFKPMCEPCATKGANKISHAMGYGVKGHNTGD